MYNKQEYNQIVLPLVRSYKQAYDLASRDVIAHTLAMECLKISVGPELDAKKLSDYAGKFESWVTLPAIGFVPLVLRVGSTKLKDILTGSKTPTILGAVKEDVKNRKLPGRGLDRGFVKVKKLHLSPQEAVKQLARSRPKVSQMPKLGMMRAAPTTQMFDPTGAINAGFKILVAIGPLLGRLQMQQSRLVGMDKKVVPARWTSKVGQVLAKTDKPEQLAKNYEASLMQLDAVWGALVLCVQEADIIHKQLDLPGSVKV